MDGWILRCYCNQRHTSRRFPAARAERVGFPNSNPDCLFFWALTGLWPAIRLPFYIVLLLGTIMVVLFGRCSIAMVLKHMPWNRERAPRLV